MTKTYHSALGWKENAKDFLSFKKLLGEVGTTTTTTTTKPFSQVFGVGYMNQKRITPDRAHGSTWESQALQNENSENKQILETEIVKSNDECISNTNYTKSLHNWLLFISSILMKTALLHWLSNMTETLHKLSFLSQAEKRNCIRNYE